MAIQGWHASPRRDAEVLCDGRTGEVRIPLRLMHVDTPQGDVDFVLSGSEAAVLLERLTLSVGGAR
ncbi:hypothetical protein ACH4SP_42225 [Streptomyces sp. NPDC021093]|uniref:hypothetical protein n=1 Tax=Streptomyces sp. NPDC021093 TaxID=3365112 RepID=UPI0037B75938